MFNDECFSSQHGSMFKDSHFYGGMHKDSQFYGVCLRIDTSIWVCLRIFLRIYIYKPFPPSLKTCIKFARSSNIFQNVNIFRSINYNYFENSYIDESPVQLVHVNIFRNTLEIKIFERMSHLQDQDSHNWFSSSNT